MLQLILAALLSAQAAYPEMIPVQETAVVGRAAPGVSLQTLQGEDFSLEAARGEVVVFAFWASWCGPCRREMPALKQLQANLTDKPVQIVLINVDKDARDARRFLQQIGMTETDLKVIMDNEARVMGEYGVMSMPTTFLIDKNGTVKFSKVGYSTEKGLAELETAIAEALR